MLDRLAMKNGIVELKNPPIAAAAERLIEADGARGVRSPSAECTLLN